jgi:hypothetical protein
MKKLRTQKEIENLKNDWCNDPCWDIEDTEGFEAHHEELKKYGDEMRMHWKRERELKYEAELKTKAMQLGCENNLALVGYIIRLEKRLSEIEDMIYELQSTRN